MDLKEVQISEIKNLNLIYIFTTDNILRGKSEKYIGIKIVYDDNRTISLDYKDKYFEKFIKRIIERYNKEKSSRNIILLGDLTKKIINDKSFESLGKENTHKTVGISIFNTNNYELKKYEVYLIETLKNILKIAKGYEVIEIDKIDGYNNKFVVYYSVGTVKLEMHIILSFKDENHIDFRINHIDGINLNITGSIENNINNVLIKWSSKTTKLNGKTLYNAMYGLTEKTINSDIQTIYHSENSETVLKEDIELISFYLKLFNIPILKNIIKTDDNNYILGENEIINDIDEDIFYKNNGIQISIKENLVIIRYQVTNELSKYNNKINVTLSKNLTEFILTKMVFDKESYVLVEQKNTNEFGTSYNYNVYKTENFDLTKPFETKNMLNIDTDVSSIDDIKRYIKKKEGEKK